MKRRPPTLQNLMAINLKPLVVFVSAATAQTLGSLPDVLKAPQFHNTPTRPKSSANSAAQSTSATPQTNCKWCYVRLDKNL
jgi:hypothetical protein